jgi:hypothetical protein
LGMGPRRRTPPGTRQQLHGRQIPVVCTRTADGRGRAPGHPPAASTAPRCSTVSRDISTRNRAPRHAHCTRVHACRPAPRRRPTSLRKRPRLRARPRITCAHVRWRPPLAPHRALLVSPAPPQAQHAVEPIRPRPPAPQGRESARPTEGALGRRAPPAPARQGRDDEEERDARHGWRARELELTFAPPFSVTPPF